MCGIMSWTDDDDFVRFVLWTHHTENTIFLYFFPATKLPAHQI